MKLNTKLEKKFYYAWENAFYRCTSKPSRKQEQSYYGLEVWKTYELYAQDMYESFLEAYKRDPECSLDRLDNIKGYSKENCRWATKQQQQFNKSTSNRFLAISQENEAYVVNSGNAFATDFALAYSEISRMINGKTRSAAKVPRYKGWRFFRIDSKYTNFIQKERPYIAIGQAFISPESFDALIDSQRELGYAKGYPSLRDQMGHVSQNSLALVIELGEMLQELPHKPWQAIEKQPNNKVAAQEEFVDIYFFLMNIAIAMEWKYQELVLLVAHKRNKILVRVAQGYGAQD